MVDENNKNNMEEAKPQEKEKTQMQNKSDVATSPVNKPKSKENVYEVENELEKEFEGEYDNKIYFTSKDVILGIINIITVVLLVIFLVKLPEKATELKNLRIEAVKSETPLNVLDSDLVEDGAKADKLESLFLNQSGIVDFVNEVEKLKVEGGTIQKVSFASQKPIKDKTGLSGIPIVIEMRGGWEGIGNDLQKIEALPYLMRAASIDASLIPDNPGVIDFKYGGFLYVNDELGKN